MQRETVFRYFVLLLALFLAGFLGLVILDRVFDDLVGRLEARARNERARMAIGQDIVDRLGQVQTHFFQLATASTLQGQKLLRERVQSDLDEIRHALRLLEEGGSLRQRIPLNLETRDEMVREFVFRPPALRQIILEVIDLRPKLIEVEQKTDQLAQLVARLHAHQARDDRDRTTRTLHAVLMFVKTAPPLFLRMTESANKIFHDASVQLGEIEQEAVRWRRRYNLFESGLVVAILAAVLALSAVLAGKVRRIVARQQRAEAALRASEERLRTILDTVPTGVMLVDPVELRIVEANREALRMMDAEEAQVLGRSCSEVLCPRREGPCPLAGGDLHMHQTEQTLITADGSEVPILKNAVGVTLAGRRYILESFVDIAKRRQAEERVRKLSRAVEQSPAAVVITDTEGRIEYVNPGFTQLSGYTFDEVRGRNPRFLKADLTPPSVYEDLWQTIASGREWRGELHNRKKTGELFWEEAFISPIFDEEGSTSHYLAILQDITERRRNQEELRRAKETAEVAARTKSEFLANMSHEIRTPLNAVIGLTGLLLDSDVTAEQRDYLETLRSSGDNLLTIINDILDFSRIEAGRLELEHAPFPLRDCVEEAVELLAPQAQARGLEIAAYLEPDTPEVVVGDVTRLRQVLVNLVGNAVKFTRAGSVLVEVKEEGREHVSDGDDSRSLLHFMVRDTGIGIPRERMAALFEPFSQVDASTTRKYGGSGLGLAISRQLIDRMGGTLWVESEEGKGSTFHFTLTTPLAPARLRHDPASDELAGKRALVVDRGRLYQDVLGRTLAVWGMQSLAVATAALAAARLADPETAVDVVLVDRYLAGSGNGEDALDEVVRVCRERDVPLVLVVSLGRGVDADGVYHHAVLSRPFKNARLRRVLTDALSGGTPSAAGEEVDPVFEPNLAARHPLRILLVEDNAINQKVATRILARMGYRVDVASHGREAIEVLERTDYDVVFMDVQMPEMDGVQATQHIRTHLPPGRQPRIVAMTAHAMAGDREKYLAVGMDDYVSKPVRPEMLKEVLLRSQAHVRRGG